jgi:2,4-dienoyl-CoA reductase-like NADH-dependent reductase (Old Yellow Enzyme family)
VVQAAVRSGMTDLLGIARMHLADPRFISDVLDGRILNQVAQFVRIGDASHCVDTPVGDVERENRDGLAR